MSLPTPERAPLASASASVHLPRLAKVRAQCNGHQSIGDTPTATLLLGAGCLDMRGGCCFCYAVQMHEFAMRRQTRTKFVRGAESASRKMRCTEKYPSVINQVLDRPPSATVRPSLHCTGNVAPRLSHNEDGRCKSRYSVQIKEYTLP